MENEKKETPMDLMGKTDMNSQIEFMEMLNDYFRSPMGTAIINSLKELKAIKEIRNSN